MIRRDDYKAIKRMNRGEMSEYLHRVYMRGFKAGKESNTAPMERLAPNGVNAGTDASAEKGE